MPPLPPLPPPPCVASLLSLLLPALWPEVRAHKQEDSSELPRRGSVGLGRGDPMTPDFILSERGRRPGRVPGCWAGHQGVGFGLRVHPWD